MATCSDDRRAALAGPKRRQALTALLTDEFKSKFVSMCNRIKVDPYYLIQVIALETAHTFSPKICNTDGNASGLIQFMPSTAGSYFRNISGEEAVTKLRGMTAIEQLNYVERFFNNIPLQDRQRIKNVGEFYALTFYPGGFTSPDPAIQKVPGTLVLVADDLPALRGIRRKYGNNIAAYKANPSFDVNKDGYITIADLLKVVQEGTTYIPTNIFDGVDGYVNTLSTRTIVSSAPNVINQGSAGTITPYIASYKSFHPKLQAELIRRKFSTEHVDTSMPFAKLTSLMFVKSEDAAEAESADSKLISWCPSIGLHGTPNARFEEIYRPYVNSDRLEQYINDKDKATLFRNASVVGESTIATGNNKTQRRLNLVSKVSSSIEQQDPVNIPMPGITSMNIERSTAGPMGVRGGLMKANVKLVAYSVGQFDTLIRYFLRPGTPVVLEYGKTSGNNSTIKTFDWNRGSSAIKDELWKYTIVRSGDGLRLKYAVMPNTLGLLKEYVYENNGNYEILMGYAVKFTTKMNKDNIYEIDLTVHSLTQLEIPNVQSSTLSACTNSNKKCNTYDLREYFNPKSSWKKNSYSRLLATYTSSRYRELAQTSTIYKKFDTYKNDIVVVKSENSAGAEESTYFFTWRFFIEVILGDEEYGILSMFPVQSVPLLLGSMLDLSSTNGLIKHDNDYLIANEVGYHPYLRSTDPSTMIIVNKNAQTTRVETTLDEFELLQQLSRIDQKSKGKDEIPGLVVTDVDTVLENSSDFAPDTNRDVAGVSLLTKGIWINSNAIAEAFNKTDSLTQALQALLTEMSNATAGYWHLQLLSSEDSNWPGLHVVDMGISKRRTQERLSAIKRDELLTSATQPMTNKEQILATELTLGADNNNIESPKYIYVFNEKNRRLTDGDSIGSELIDLSIDFGIPTAIATQVIAGVGGTSQKPTLNLIDIDELNSLKLMPGDGLLGICSDAETGDDGDGLCRFDPRQTLQQSLKGIEEEKEARLQAIVAAGTLGGEFRDKQIRDILNEAAQKRAEAFELAAEGSNSEVVFGPMRSVLANYEPLGTALRFVELNPANMMKKLNLDSRTDVENDGSTTIPVAHAFNSSNLTKLLADLTLPGIAGIQLFQSFLIDRTPSIIDNGFYVVTKVAHEISPDRGWVTKIQGRFRYQPETENNTVGQGLHAPRPTQTPA